MNKRFDSPDFCSTLDGLLPKLKRPRRTDPVVKFDAPSKDQKSGPKEDEQGRKLIGKAKIAR